MLDEKELRDSVDLQKRSYGLLKWVAESVRNGKMAFNQIHEYTTAVESARDWLQICGADVPAMYRPPADAERFQRFANLFSSYLLTSFDLVEKPRGRLVSFDGCYCPFCMHLVAAPHLRTKKVTNIDRHWARLLKVDYVRALGHELGRDLPDEQVQALVDGELSEIIALATYASALLRRCRGEDEGTAILPLWREFAWNRQGSPKKDFELTADAILDAEKHISAAIAR